MNDDSRKDKRLAQIEASLASRVKGAGTRQDFARELFRRMPLEEMEEMSEETCATIALNLFDFIQQRSPGQTLFRTFNPVQDDQGWDSGHTVVEIVNDDMPFLVDTVVLALSELGIGVHLVIHPVMHIHRDSGGHYLELREADRDDTSPESVMHILIDRQTDPELLSRIEKRILSALHDVRKAVEDWAEMRRRASEIADELADTESGLGDEDSQEARSFFEWLANDHFTFLGYREYEIVDEGEERLLRVKEGSGLGLMREEGQKLPVRKVDSLPGNRQHQASERDPIIITKTNARSTIHRAGYMDYISVLRFAPDGTVVGEKRLIGLFTSGAYIRRCVDTPLVRRKMRTVIEDSGLRKGSHAGKALQHILETLPRDELFQATADELLDLAMGVLDLQERSQTRLFVRRERFMRFYSCLVYIPRDRFNTENREKIQSILKRALKGDRLDFAIQVGESKLARMHLIIRTRPGDTPEYRIADIERKIKQAIRSWYDELQATLIKEFGEEKGLQLHRRLGRAFPLAYTEDVSPHVASFDVANAVRLQGPDDLRMSLYKPRKRKMGLLRFKVFKFGKPIPLSEVLPMLENLGMRIVSERPYELNLSDASRLWIQDFDMEPVGDDEVSLDLIRENFQEAFEQAWRGRIENDGFNRLVVTANLNWRQVAVIRSYCKYLLQTGIPYSQAYMAQTLSASPLVARLLVELFDARFFPGRGKESSKEGDAARKRLASQCKSLAADFDDEVLEEFLDEVCASRTADSDTQQKALRKAILRSLDSVSSADQDRILRAFLDVIAATLRTNVYRTDARGNLREFFSFKLDSTQVPDLPRPRPYREIWVYSPRVEGIHLRTGKIARGGLRWSDRREDFRTEVLGLMKAQNVKNTMIVPVGAKGGFVVKQPPEGEDRDAMMAEVVSCYRSFIHGLLDITDNLAGEELLPPPEVVRQDDDDPYMVVAADKGTATFSDIANSISVEHEFWLDDAFASGGSNGYDHKKMGITAKGAWESVKRHFRELGKNIQEEPFTVVGIGDMAGDVFGNGMLLSRQIRLQAAFNHMHIFLDPDPDPEASYAERERMFSLPRSSWEDYDKSLISKGGGVFSRQAKNISLSPEVREWLGIEAEELSPQALIRELLKAPVELLWNGGIGTYVKAATESHAEVGDLANNPVRVDGRELRCQVVGEGGNLGLTQRGRIEFALGGGRINTDFIDNSAGVDCSDHEVNIKILLKQVMEDGALALEDRNRLLEEMTDEVEELVLRSNYLQTQTLSMMESMTTSRLGAEAHFIATLEHRGLLDRELEFLPDDDELRGRTAQGKGLTRPELAILFSYSKITLYQDLLDSDVPEDPYLSKELEEYFPRPLVERFPEQMQSHRLKREIIATRVTNNMVNRMGAHFANRIKEDTGASPAVVAKAYTVAREIFEARDYWRSFEALDNQVPASQQIEGFLEMWNLIRQMTRRLITLPGGYAIDISSKVNRYAPGIREFRKCLPDVLCEVERERMNAHLEELIANGFPRELSENVARLGYMYSALDIVDEAHVSSLNVRTVATVYFQLLDTLSLRWLREEVEQLPVERQWHAHARGNLRDELFSHHRALTRRVLVETGVDTGDTEEHGAVDSWFERHAEEASRARLMLEEMRNLGRSDYATLSVAVHGLRQLLNATS